MWIKAAGCGDGTCVEINFQAAKGCDSGTCVEVGFRKSPLSGAGGCVEVNCLCHTEAGGVAVRDSKDPDGPVLWFTFDEWRAFTDGVKGGEFDV